MGGCRLLYFLKLQEFCCFIVFLCQCIHSFIFPEMVGGGTAPLATPLNLPLKTDWFTVGLPPMKGQCLWYKSVKKRTVLSFVVQFCGWGCGYGIKNKAEFSCGSYHRMYKFNKVYLQATKVTSIAISIAYR